MELRHTLLGKAFLGMATFLTMAAASSCGDKIDPTPPGGGTPTPTPTPGVVTKTITKLVFENPDGTSAHNPTTIQGVNTNTGELIFAVNKNDLGSTSVKYRGLNGRNMITTAPRPGTTNVVSIDAGVGDTVLVLENGAEKIRAIFANDAANVLNGGLRVERPLGWTNNQVAAGAQDFSTATMPFTKYKN